MSWAQLRGADRDKLNDIAPIWTSLLVCSVVRCKLLLPGCFQCQDVWKGASGVRIWTSVHNSDMSVIWAHEGWRQGTRHFAVFLTKVLTERTLLGDLWQLPCYCVDEAPWWEREVIDCIVQWYKFQQVCNSYGSFSWFWWGW
jgi:hypothetical protein